MNKKHFNSQDARNLINMYGFSIFPVHGVRQDGCCTCGNSACSNIGKHPATSDGFKSASKDIEHVKAMWAGRSFLNVGIATGGASGIFVVDCDTVEAYEKLNDMIEIPRTLTVKTGRGYHIYFKYNSQKPIKNGTEIIKNIDIRGNGGYVIGAGSTHSSGAVYEFINPFEEIKDAPQGIYDLIYGNAPLVQPPALAPIKSFCSHPKLYAANDVSPEDARVHLSYINPDCDYDTWIKVGMALHEEGLPFYLFDEWSKRGAKYDGSTQTHWNSFNKGGGVSYGTVVALAKNGGWSSQRFSPLIVNKIGGDVIETLETRDIEQSFAGQDNIPHAEQRTLPVFYADDISPVTESTDFVEDLLRDREFSVVYGASNCGKTFFMLDLAMHVALGMKWRGKEVRKGGVIYAALEGGNGTKNRIVAFKRHHGIEEAIPLAVIPSNINFLDGAVDLPAFLKAIEEARSRIGNVRLIVVDTLARAMSGGDENSNQDMGQLIINADKLREATGAHITFVHHSGKDELKGARGHSSLRAAVDTEIEVSRPDTSSPSVIKIVKQREMEIMDSMSFSLKRVVLGLNERDKEVTSCVVLPCDVVDKKETARMSAMQVFMYESIVDCVDRFGRKRTIYKEMPEVLSVRYEELREVLEERGLKGMMETEKKTTAEQVKSATQSARVALKKMNKISFNGEFIWLIS